MLQRKALHLCSHLQQWRPVLDLLHALRQSSPASLPWKDVLLCLAHCGEWQRAMSVLREMHAAVDWESNVDTSTHTGLVTLATRQGDGQQALMVRGHPLPLYRICDDHVCLPVS